MEYPELAARTRRFTYGAPRGVAVGADGERVVFLRSSGPEDPVDRLYVHDVATGTERLIADPARLTESGSDELTAAERALRERTRLSASGIGSFGTDRNATMAAFALVYVGLVLRDNRFVIDNGFYLAVGFYGAQRFLWEFFKPYGTLIGPFTLFHMVSIALQTVT